MSIAPIRQCLFLSEYGLLQGTRQWTHQYGEPAVKCGPQNIVNLVYHTSFNLVIVQKEKILTQSTFSDTPH